MPEYGNQVASDEAPALPSADDWQAAMRDRVSRDDPMNDPATSGTAYGRPVIEER